jgi:HAMP domain-containing protein
MKNSDPPMPAFFPIISIRYGTPLLILACTVALATYTAHRDRRAAEALVQGHAVSQMMTRMEALSALLDHAFRTEPPDQAQERLAVFAAGLGPDEAAVAGPSAIVLAATRPQWVGQPLFGTAELRAGMQADESLEAVVERVRGLRLPEVHVSGSGSQVVGFCPVEFGGPAPGRAGVLIVQRDLSQALATARATAERNAAGMAATLAAMAAALGVLIHCTVIRRLYTVVRAAGQFAEGKLDTRTRLKGRDEVAALGRAFDHMADQVAGQQRELERRVQERTQDLAKTANFAHPAKNVKSALPLYLPRFPAK